MPNKNGSTNVYNLLHVSKENETMSVVYVIVDEPFNCPLGRYVRRQHYICDKYRKVENLNSSWFCVVMSNKISSKSESMGISREFWFWAHPEPEFTQSSFLTDNFPLPTTRIWGLSFDRIN